MGHLAVVINDIIDELIEKILSIKNKNWHIHMHFMDVHDHRAINNFINLVKRLRFFLNGLLKESKEILKYRFLYVSATMDIDENLGKFFKRLEKEKIIDEILFVITADHASYYPESPRKKLDVALRTHYEDLDIPFIMANTTLKPKKGSMCDSMDITATFLKQLGINIKFKYKGKNVLSEKKLFVISESCGGGNSDIKKEKTSTLLYALKKYKLMAILNNYSLTVTKFFDLQKESLN